jgi:hypothetical protein
MLNCSNFSVKRIDQQGEGKVAMALGKSAPAHHFSTGSRQIRKDNSMACTVVGKAVGGLGGAGRDVGVDRLNSLWIGGWLEC